MFKLFSYKNPKSVFQFLASTELAVALFVTICLFAIPGTFIEKKEFYASPLFLTLLGLFGLNLIFCTVRRWKFLSRSVLVLHGGVLLTFAGCIVSSFGFVATVNIYEGSMVDKVYRWDTKEDTSLGVDLTVKKINREYYPIPVKVGVLKGQEKVGLFTLKTGESFTVDKYIIKVAALELPSEILKLNVLNDNHFIGSCDTSGAKNLPPDFPYDFKLVAFQNPSLKRLWVDLLLSRNSEKIAEGTSEVNKPFQWEGLYFFNTQIDHDPDGMPFAGIQIVKDPGRPLVFAGFAIAGLGAVLSSIRRFYRKGQWI